MHTVVADAGRAALLPVSGDAVADLTKAGELLGVDMEHVSGMLPLVALQWRFGLEIPQPPEAKAVENLGHGGEESGQQPGDVPEVEVLVLEIHGLLQYASPGGCGERSVDCQFGYPALSIEGRPLAGTAEADSCFCSHLRQGPVLMQVFRHQSQPSSLRQEGIGY